MADVVKDVKIKVGVEDKATASFERMARQSAIAFAAITAAIGFASKAALAFEEGIAKVSTLLPTGSSHLKEYEKGLKAIAVSGVKASLSDLTEAMYQALSASVKAGDALEFTKTAAQAATAGFTDTATSVDALTTVLNAYKMQATEAKYVSDVLFAAQNVGKTTFAEMAGYLGFVIPVAAAVDLKFEEIAGAIASLTKQGIPTRTAMTGLRAILSAFVTQGDQAKLSTMGLSGALNELYEKSGGNVQKIQEYLGGVEAITPALALMGANAAGTAEDLKLMYEAAGTADEAFKKMTDNTTGAINALKGSIAAMRTEIGTAFLPVLKNILEKITPIARGIGEWASEHVELVRVVGLGAIGLTGFLTVSIGLAVILPKVAAGITMMNAALNVMAASAAFKFLVSGTFAAIAGAVVAVGGLAYTGAALEIEKHKERAGKTLVPGVGYVDLDELSRVVHLTEDLQNLQGPGIQQDESLKLWIANYIDNLDAMEAASKGAGDATGKLTDRFKELGIVTGKELNARITELTALLAKEQEPVVIIQLRKQLSEANDALTKLMNEYKASLPSITRLGGILDPRFAPRREERGLAVPRLGFEAPGGSEIVPIVPTKAQIAMAKLTQQAFSFGRFFASSMSTVFSRIRTLADVTKLSIKDVMDELLTSILQLLMRIAVELAVIAAIAFALHLPIGSVGKAWGGIGNLFGGGGGTKGYRPGPFMPGGGSPAPAPVYSINVNIGTLVGTDEQAVQTANTIRRLVRYGQIAPVG